MEYTEHDGKYYIGGVLRVMRTPDDWTIFKRKSMQGNDYEPMQGEHYETAELALEAAETIMRAKETAKC